MLGMLAMGGCALPERVSESERLTTALADLEAISVSQEPVRGSLDLYDAMARSLKYNLDRRIRDVEAFYAAGEFDLAKYKLLPTVDAGIGRLRRNNEQASTSRGSDSASISVEKDRSVGDARVLWNTLDFGVSYLKMQQDGNAVWIAKEAERKVTNRILADTRRAYWRAVAAERIAPLLAPISGSANAAITSARKARERGDLTPTEALEYERRMLQAIRELERRQQLLALSRAELAALINVDPVTPVRVRAGQMSAPGVPGDLGTLRTIALMYRPELYEHDYKARIAALERQVEILSTLPGLRANVGYNYDSNKYLVNADWFEVGTRLSVQLNQLITLPARLAQADTRELLVQAQRRAMTLSVVTQVHLALRAYAAKRREFDLAARMLKTEGQRLTALQASKEASAAGEAQVVEARANHAMAQLDYYFTFAEVQEAYAAILTSLGIDTSPEASRTAELPVLSTELRRFFERDMPSRLARQMAEAGAAIRLVATTKREKASAPAQAEATRQPESTGAM
jgi:outer membrane protein TolC